ncbi:alpha-amylase family glycosyl hydrolase [Paenibacillus lignilyticus]|uniref:Alpha-glucosidase C-terminal domain-containing protein n=1 Tax=Paenibacillus lignilyticus TaxID=1172615 RepID=A0ABS5CFT4_9BACL|nr:alpha-amylase family glycosyl hydrolase [Paenibacillus lignilyticus]MBP3964725.1 alpha-glucosidase C-terminal domain-containing protein [Paenibacillus lignilyticus]
MKRFVALPLAVCLFSLACLVSACSSSNREADKPAANAVSEQKQNQVQKSLGTAVPDWSEKAVMYEVNIRQYTKEGTFKAFEAHLPRLKELGVDILWLMPIHPISKKNRNGTLGSYYAVDDYKAVNPEFGTEADFRALVNKAHLMGFKVMLDWVANHTGWDNPWLANPGWYTTDENGDIVQPAGTNWTDVADLNYDNADMQAAMIDALKYWVKEFDIDGYRCDYAGGVPTAFWEKARAELEQIKPVFMLAEDDQQLGLLKHAFNANYGWQLYNMMNRIAKGLGNAEQVKKYGERLAKTYPGGTYPLNFTSNHDENSWTGTEYERLKDAVEPMAALSFLMPGMPLIYAGQEAGLNKRLQFFEKDEIEWDDLAMSALYTDLIRLKHDNPALWNGASGGAYHTLAAGDNGDILAFERTKDSNTVIVVMNLSGEPVKSTIQTGGAAGSYQAFPSGAAADVQAEQPIELAPWEYLIYTH